MSDYILVYMDHSYCPKCETNVYLLSPTDDQAQYIHNTCDDGPAFFICQSCGYTARVGDGPVKVVDNHGAQQTPHKPDPNPIFLLSFGKQERAIMDAALAMLYNVMLHGSADLNKSFYQDRLTANQSLPVPTSDQVRDTLRTLLGAAQI